MKRIAPIFRFVYDTWYGAGICFASALFALTILSVLKGILYNDSPYWLMRLCDSVAILTVGCFANGVLAVSLSLVRRRWCEMLVQAEVFVGLLILFALVSALLFSLGLEGPTKDYFASDLKMPDNVVCLEPRKDRSGGHEDCLADCTDEFSQTLLRAAASTGAVGKAIPVSLSALDRLAESRREVLIAYLAAHPGWRLREANGAWCASRRWKTGNRWVNELRGDYGEESSPTEITLGFPGFFDASSDGVCPLEGEAEVFLDERYGPSRGSLRLQGKNASVCIYDQDVTQEWRKMRAAVSLLGDEFGRLENVTSAEGVRSLLPEGAVKRGCDSFILREGLQGGKYSLATRLNPGEAGSVYVKAFEVTKGTRLSARRITEATDECVGWSEDPEEKFLSKVEFTVYEGDWECYYAARFEVWFRPLTGAPERKLLSRVYRIQGWQR